MKTIFSVLALLFAISGAAQNGLTLGEALQIGLEENLSIRVARRDLNMASAGNNLGNAGFLPSLNAQGSYQYSENDFTQELANQPEAQTVNGAVSENTSASLNLNYTLFNGLGRLYNLQQLQIRENLSQTQLRFTVENTLLQIVSSYFEAARQSQQQSVAQRAVELSLERYQRAKEAEKLGSGSKLEKLSAQVDLNNDSTSLLQAQTDRDRAISELNRLLNFPADTNYAVDTTVQVNYSIDPESLREKALKNNAALVQAQFSRELAQKDVNLAWSQYAPNIRGSVGYNLSRQENEGSFLRLTESNGISAGITATWTLFNGARTKTQIEQAKINLDKSRLELEQTQQKLRSDLEKAYLDFRNNARLLRLQQRNLSTAELNFERARSAYRLGQITNTQLREAQLNLKRTEQQIVNLRYALKLSELEMLRIAGTLINQF